MVGLTLAFAVAVKHCKNGMFGLLYLLESWLIRCFIQICVAKRECESGVFVHSRIARKATNIVTFLTFEATTKTSTLSSASYLDTTCHTAQCSLTGRLMERLRIQASGVRGMASIWQYTCNKGPVLTFGLIQA